MSVTYVTCAGIFYLRTHMNKRNLIQKIEELNLPLGMTHRGSCPVCKRDKTFTVSNDNGTLLYNCYSNSCNISGAVRIGLTVDDIKQYFLNNGFRNAKAPAPFVMPQQVVYDSAYTKPYADKYGIDHEHLGLRYDVAEQRIVFPITHGGVIVDAIGRSIVNAQPKWLRYGEARTAYVTGTGPVAVVVEDAVSAAVVETLGGTGFALLGTTLLTEHLGLLHRYASVIVALDPDARKSTITITRELKSNGVNAIAFPLHDDLKYREEDDVTQLKHVIETADSTWN